MSPARPATGAPSCRRGAAIAFAVAATLSAALSAAMPATAPAQTTVAEVEAARLVVDGYVRTITLLHDRGFDLPSLPGLAPLARETGSHGQVLRLKWRLEGERWRLEVHDRIQVRVASESAGDQVIGFGVGAEPERLVSLRTDFVRRDRLLAWHDIDRLALVVQAGPVDLTVGRQAVTWGTAMLFPVADLWATFSPFEQDTEEKPGIDAARALFYPASGVEMDVVVAHRGDLDDLSAGVRATISRPGADLWVGAGKFWRQLAAMGGVTLLRDHSRWRVEAVVPWDMDDPSFQLPRVTLGADWLGGTRSLGLEYHYNGIGRAAPDGYLDAFADPRLRRGESYYLGRHYAGAMGAWSPDEETRLNLAVTALVNLGDRSAALTPTASYDLGQAVRLSLGALVSAGAPPDVNTVPPFIHPRTEFGLYGNALFTLLSVYF
jgi:hypothetical protein